MRLILSAILTLWAGTANAAAAKGDYLVKVANGQSKSVIASLKSRLPQGTFVEELGLGGWVHVQLPKNSIMPSATNFILNQAGVLKLERNNILKLQATWQVHDQELIRKIKSGEISFPSTSDNSGDNPPIPKTGSGGSGSDPLYSKQWGMNQMGVKEAWSITKGSPDIVVGVIDTGVDYTHEDLVDNLWRNPGEMGRDAQGRDKSDNGVDDDGNGFVDDVIGWDFSDNDNKPYDLKASLLDMILSGGNPGHGTHCAGNVAARADNGKGIGGVAPNVRIMALRFISQKGQGTTADAVKAIKYGVDMGARVLSNSWGSEGEDDGGNDSQTLKDAINYAKDHNVMFVAAAGNGHQGKGYDNDTDAKPGYPASYPIENIISVAAIDEAGNLGAFSNWGAKTVHLAAPGVKVFSTTVGNNYEDTVINMPALGIVATWDGTSMATPHVAGAAALYWSKHPGAKYQDVKQAIIDSVKRNSGLSGKTVSGGQLDVRSLMNK